MRIQKQGFQQHFTTLERAINCLYELEHVNGVPFGEMLSQSLSKYTLEAKDCGIWDWNTHSRQKEGKTSLKDS